MRYWLREGLGDACHFAQVLGCLAGTRAHYPRDEPIYPWCGVPWTGVQATRWVYWRFPANFNDGTLSGSRIYHNLPTFTREPETLWAKLCATRFHMPPRLPHEGTRILLHPAGTSYAAQKNLHTASLWGLVRMLAELGTVLVLPVEGKTPWLPAHPRIQLVPRGSHADLAALFQSADLFVGVDSGPFHFSRFFDLPKLFLGWRHHPHCVTIPDPQALYLALPHAVNGTLPAWRLREWSGYHRQAADLVASLLPGGSLRRPESQTARLAGTTAL